jgi:hypothetical protein
MDEIVSVGGVQVKGANIEKQALVDMIIGSERPISIT